MAHSVNEKGDLLEIVLNGTFTYADNKYFNEIIENISNNKYKTMTIDLKAVDYIDSAALGILLLMRDKCEKSGTKLLIRNPLGQVERMFDISRLYDILTIEKD